MGVSRHSTVVSRQVSFDAAHMILNHPGKCRNLHGHTYTLTAFARGEVDPETGMVIDFVNLKVILNDLLDQVDHQYLNDVFPDMLTTVENLAGTFLGILHRWDERIFKVTLSETPTTTCTVELLS